MGDNFRGWLLDCDDESKLNDVARRVIIELLTEEGSVAYAQSAGCGFVGRLRHCANEYDVGSAFSAARSKILRKLDAIGVKASMKLETMIIDDGAISLHVLVSNGAGVVRVITPFFPIYTDARQPS